jgi:hypothetical protein
MAGCNPENPEDRAVVHIKSNLSKPGKAVGYAISEKYGFEWKSGTALTEQMIMGTAAREEKAGSALDEAKEFLRDVLKDGKRMSREVKELAELMGVSERTLQRAKNEIGAISKRDGFAENGLTYWILP